MLTKKKLKNGPEADEAVIVTTMMNLRNVADGHPLAVIYLLRVCERPDTQIPRICVQPLIDAGLITEIGIDKSVRDIVLSAVSVEGTKPIIESPIAEESSK